MRSHGTFLYAPALTAAAPRRSGGIVGAGMAGVSLAWLLDGQRHVILIGSGDAIGGNVRASRSRPFSR